jgi:hypothetical protein
MDLLSALVELRKKRPNLFRRVMSATEVFFESYYNSTEVSHKARILLQASAFEILLNTKSGEGRKEMKKFINQFADYPDDERVSYKSKRSNKIIVTTGTMREKWADSFFTLRNSIIHGDMPKDRDYMFGSWQRHFDIAHYFFVFTMKREVERALRRNIFNDDVVWKTWTDDLREKPKKMTGFEYDRYGRRGWERILKRVSRKKV